MSRHRALYLAGALWISLLGVAAAAAPTEEATASPAAATSPAQYRLQIGDVVGVVVLGEAAYSGSFPIRANGSILFSDDMVGNVAIAGLTVEEATRAVSKRIGEFVRDPSVSLTINRFKAMVVGEVRQPGQYDLDSGARLAEAIGRAGGPLDEKRDLARTFVMNVAGLEVSYDLRAFRERGDTSQNPVLSPGDRISVGREVGSLRSEYRVSGAVKKTGYFPIEHERETRVSDAVEACGRWTEEANPRAARLLRKDGTKLTLDLSVLDGDPTSEDNKVLVEGDELYVPRNPVQISVLGGVKKEGQYRVPTGTSLLEAIAIAGGLSENALLRDCVIMRGGPNPTQLPVNLERLTRNGDMSQNPTLLDRDIIMVPVRSTDPKRRGLLDTVTDTFSRYWWLFRVW